MVDFSNFAQQVEARKRERAERAPRVVFTGSRNWGHETSVAAVVRALDGAGYRRAAHGAARGLDAIVDRVARPIWGDEVKRYPANWKTLGKRAGIERNLGMLREEEPHLVVAFPLAGSIGTWHCAVAADCPTLVFLGGVRDEIADKAREWQVEHLDRVAQVEAWVTDQVRVQVSRSGYLPWPRITMPRPSKSWALLSRSGEGDPRSQAGLDALLGA